jgi:hypothetical protein
MIRLPKQLLDIQTVQRYCVGESASAFVAGEYVILDFTSDEDDGYFDDGGEGWLTSIVPCRADLAAGDLRALYIAWLLCVEAGFGTQPPRVRSWGRPRS